MLLDIVNSYPDAAAKIRRYRDISEVSPTPKAAEQIRTPEKSTTVKFAPTEIPAEKTVRPMGQSQKLVAAAYKPKPNLLGRVIDTFA